MVLLNSDGKSIYRTAKDGCVPCSSIVMIKCCNKDNNSYSGISYHVVVFDLKVLHRKRDKELSSSLFAQSRRERGVTLRWKI